MDGIVHPQTNQADNSAKEPQPSSGDSKTEEVLPLNSMVSYESSKIPENSFSKCPTVEEIAMGVVPDSIAQNDDSRSSGSLLDFLRKYLISVLCLVYVEFIFRMVRILI